MANRLGTVLRGKDDTGRGAARGAGRSSRDGADTGARVRIDKWLWAARIFRTRSVASESLAKNRVRVGGQRAKPSRIVQVGDVISVEKGPYEFELTVLGVADERRAAPLASLLYEESAGSVAAREAIRARRRADREARLGLAGEGRPSRNQRRDRLRWQRGGGDSPDTGDAEPDGPPPAPDQ